MSRYIDADKMLDGYSTTFPYNITYCDDGDLMEWINNQPTADVVPRSEVERLEDHNKQLRYDVKKIQTKTRKEFVNMLKQRMYKNVSAPTPGQRYVMKKFTELLDNLAEEMERENDR